MNDIDEVLVALDRPELGRDAVFMLISRWLELRFPDAKITFAEDETIAIAWQSGETTKISLHNLWAECERATTERRAIVERYLGVLAEGDADEEKPAIADIVPLVRDQQYVEYINKDRDKVTTHLAGDLWVVYGVDRPSSTTVLLPEEMVHLGVEQEHLDELACENLRRLIPEVEVVVEGEWRRLESGENELYLSGMLVYGALWDLLETSVEGRVVVVVPARDTVLFTGEDNSVAIRAMRAEAERIFRTGHHLVSCTLLRRENGAWRVFG